MSKITDRKNCWLMESLNQAMVCSHTNLLLPDPTLVYTGNRLLLKINRSYLKISIFREEGLLASLCDTCLCHVVTFSIHQLRNKVSEEHDTLKKKELESGPKASHGYGGRFGVERDRMDKVS